MTIEEQGIFLFHNKTEFSKQDYYELLKNNGYIKKYSSFLVGFQKLINEGMVHRTGRNKYSASENSHLSYSHLYSDEAIKISECIKNEHPFVDFVIFETVQLNEFINHQIGKNTIFVYTDNEVADFVYETLNSRFYGPVMVSPKVQEFHKYRKENCIVIKRLITESPKKPDTSWQITIEKLLVDIIADRIVRETFNESEINSIYETAFERYIIDKSKLLRYAHRRNAAEKVKKYLDTNNHPED